MLEGWKPLDLSAFSQSRATTTNDLAKQILANTTWTPLDEVKSSISLTNPVQPTGGAQPTHDVGFLSRLFSGLSTPLYTVANATDEALAGHQSSSTDSVLSDVGNTVGGVFTGAAGGFTAGLRGAFGTDEGASDMTDRTRSEDVLNRFYLQMSTEEALDPANRQEVIDRLTKAKVNQLGGSDPGNLLYPAGVGDEQLEDYFGTVKYAGIADDFIGDPLNFIGLPIKAVSSSAKAAGLVDEGTDVKNLSKSSSTVQPINTTAQDIAPVDSSKILTPGSHTVSINPGSVQNSVIMPSTGELIKPPTWFEFPSNPTRTTPTLSPPPPKAPTSAPQAPVGASSPSVGVPQPSDFDALLAQMSSSGELSSARVQLPTNPVGNVPELRVGSLDQSVGFKPVEGLSKTPKAKVVDDIPKLASSNKVQADTAKDITREILINLNSKSPSKSWLYKAADKYGRMGNLSLDRTFEYLTKVSENPDAARAMVRAKGPNHLFDIIRGRIKADSDAFIRQATGTHKKQEVPLNTADQIIDQIAIGARADIPTTSGAGKLKPEHQQIANSVVGHYKDMILGEKAAAGMKNPEAYNKAIRDGKNVRYSGPQQAQMLNRIINTLPQFKKASDAARYGIAARILNQVETYFISKGAIPHSAVAVKDSVPLRLSQVMLAVGPQAIARDAKLMTEILKAFDAKAVQELEASVAQAVEKVKAENAIITAPAVGAGIRSGEELANLFKSQPLSAALTEQAATITEKVAETIAKHAGAGETGAKIAADTVRNLTAPVSKVDTAINRSRLNSTAVMANGTFKNYARYANAPSITRAVVEEAQLPWPRTLANKVEGLVPEWLGARFNAAYKNIDMRHTYLRHAATAKSTTARRAMHINELVKKFGRDENTWATAFKIAQGIKTPVVGTPEAELAKEAKRIMENLFGSSGLKKNAALETSVVGRSQLIMNELNENMLRYGMKYKFTNKADVSTGFGNKKDYSKGIDWLNSWETWKIENPIDFMYRIQNIVESTVREKIMFDDIAARWGSYARKPGRTTKVNHPRFTGVYFSKDHAEQINTFLKNLREIKKPNSKPMQLFDTVLSKWKASVTIYMPSHHIRNMIGDVYFNWMAGVNSSRPYTQALNVLRSQKGKYEGLDDLTDLTSPDALVKAITQGRNPGRLPGDKTVLTMKNGTAVTHDMLYVSAFQQGILPSARVLEDIPDDANMLERFRPLKGKGQKAAHTIAETRDHFIRLTHYIDSLTKAPKGLSFEQAVEQAASTVRKWHPDGMDLTPFERNAMRRIFPFYSWTRKALPLIVESIMANPGKTMAYPKAMNAIQQATGIDASIEDPFPVDQLFPQWLRDKGVGPILGGPGDYAMLNPSNPMLDIGADMNHPVQFAAGMVNPAFQIPAEVATGTNVDTATPITDWSNYWTSQIPGVSVASRLTNVDIGGVSPKFEEQGFGNNQNLINFITAAGYLQTGPYQKSAQFDLRDYLRSQNGN